MATVPFAHLHLHTQYSLLDGAIKHNPLFERVKALGQEAIAMTDHGNLFGAIEFYEKARANGVKPIIGCEAYIASGSRFDKERREHDNRGFDAISHQLLLAMNETGYRNLMMLISKAWLEGFYYKPRIDLELLANHSEGLITTSGCLSSLVCRRLLGGETDEAWQLVEELSRSFKDRYYLELQRHGIPAQDKVNAELVKMAADLRLPLLATNDAHYLEHDDHDHHDALLCIGTGSNLDDPKRFRFDGQGFFVKSGEEMLEVFHDCPEAVRNTMVIAERCELEIPMGNYQMPEFQVPAGMEREQVLERDTWQGLRARLGMEVDEPFENTRAHYARRIEHELRVINEMGFAGYFLIVADFINYAKRSNIPVGPGRGSSAGSLTAYSLGITSVDPIEHDIIFERFLNPERVSMPDIDVDFCIRGRDQVIDYVASCYDDKEKGDEGRRVAQIITFGSLQARAVIRDVGRVMGMPYGEVDRIAKLVPETLGISLEEAQRQSSELRARIEGEGRVRQLFDTARKLEGLVRHASTHAAGVVIGTGPLIEKVPLYRDSRTKDVVTQFDMHCIEKLGLIKFDFLGLRTLTIIADAEKHIRAGGLAAFSAERIPLDDKASYDLLCRGDTEGVFQMESSGITELVMKLKPRSFKEVIPLIALYRPGPLGSGMVDDYVSRKHGLTPVKFLIPELKELLTETLGVIVYQDQVLQIANQLAGYTLGEADLLRRAMGKKQPEEMAKHEARFVDGCAEKKNIKRSHAGTLFEQIVEFAGYGFPKAHATAYAFLTYQTAYLKANHPREFLAALLSIEAGNPNKLGRYIAHARASGIEVLPPDVNESGDNFTPVTEGIRFGLIGVKNTGAAAIQAILEARDETGPFRDLFDFTRRVDRQRVNRRAIESLMMCGAFDSLHPNRAAVVKALDTAIETGVAAQRDRKSGQTNLFGEAETNDSTQALPDEPPWTDSERLAFEKEFLGFYVTGHPLEAQRPVLARLCDVRSGATEGKVGRPVRAGGLLTKLRETRTRRGQTMAFATLEDLEGSFELVIFADAFESHRELLKRARSGEGEMQQALPLLVRGTLESAEPAKILVEDIFTLANAEDQLAVELHIRLQAPDASRARLAALRKMLEKRSGDCSVRLHLLIPGQSETLLALPEERSVEPDDALLQEINTLFGRPVAELTL